MEFEMSDEPDQSATDEDGSLAVKDHSARRNPSSVSLEDRPELKDKALHIPEEED